MWGSPPAYPKLRRRATAPQAGSQRAYESTLDQALRDTILLITLLVAFLEASALQLSPQPHQVVMGFAGILSPHSEPDEPT